VVHNEPRSTFLKNEKRCAKARTITIITRTEEIAKMLWQHDGKK